jgi:arginine deiminase
MFMHMDTKAEVVEDDLFSAHHAHVPKIEQWGLEFHAGR